MAIDFTLNKGTTVMIGTMSLRLKSDTPVVIEAASMDHVAEMFASGAGPREFGEHLARMKHTETRVEQTAKGPIEVTLEVTYGAFGARQEKRVDERPFEAPPPLRAAAAAAPPHVDKPEGVAVKRYPDEVLTATDPPRADAPVVVAPGEPDDFFPAEETAPAEERSDDLPEDFPGFTALKSHGVTKYSEVSQYTFEELQEIRDIGPKTAEQIIDVLEERAAG